MITGLLVTIAIVLYATFITLLVHVLRHWWGDGS
jgi:hypothetical protein